jgi:hypothetical protein
MGARKSTVAVFRTTGVARRLDSNVGMINNRQVLNLKRPPQPDRDKLHP